MKWFRGKKKGAMAAVMLLATPLVAQYEGLRLKAYLDPVNVPTICYGETEGVKMGQVQTVENCQKMLTAKLGSFALAVDYMVEPEISDEQLAAYSSMAYNIGIGAFQKSTVLKLANANKFRESCDYMLKYKYAGGRILQGLVKRREAERKLCLSGLK